MDWQSRDDDRNADPGWQADWQRGHEIGWLIVVELAFLMAVVSVLLGGWETPVERRSTQSGQGCSTLNTLRAWRGLH
jgi:hypothetical protein